MKFGKLPSVDQVDFSLPAPPAENGLVFSALPPKPGKTKVYIGCTGWSMKEWVGRVYPAGTKTKDFLLHYGKQFNTIELNTTHYRIPTIETLNKWKGQTPEDFKFCPKIPQVISHSKSLGIGTDRIEAFCSVIQQLKEKLGCCFLQLSPYFGVDKSDKLKAFLNHFPSHIPLAIEFRHESWFVGSSEAADLFTFLREKNRGMVITDVAGRRDVLHMRLTNHQMMIRFVGNGLHPTDYTRIDAWIDQLNQWIEAGLHEIFFFPHEPDNILAPELSLYLVEKLKKFDHLDVRGPSLRDKDQGGQISLF